MLQQRRDDEDFEAIARQLRKRLGIDDQLRPDMITVIIKLKHLGMITNYVRVPDKEMPDDEAYYDSERKLLHVRESTFTAANAMFTYSQPERRRARYTIAHEVAHIALGHDGIRFRGGTNALAEETVAKIRHQEREADRFAAAFLAPAHLAE